MISCLEDKDTLRSWLYRFKLEQNIMEVWVEQYHPIDLHEIEKRESGKYSESNWIKVKERCLMK